jgi:hypothetical protein
MLASEAVVDELFVRFWHVRVGESPVVRKVKLRCHCAWLSDLRGVDRERDHGTAKHAL